MKLIMFLSVALSSSLVLAGVTNGGGGKAIVCRDQNRQIISAQVLDLFEAENQYGLTLLPSARSLDEALSEVALRLESLSGQRRYMMSMKKTDLEAIYKKFKFLAPGIGLQPIDDSMDLLRPEHCEIEQLAFFKEANIVLVNQDIWNHLTPQNQAALIVHETIYQLQRRQGAKDSRDSRKIVGHLFSTVDLQNVMGLIPARGEVIQCETEKKTNVFYMTKDDLGNVQITFAMLDGQSVYSLTQTISPINSLFFDIVTGASEGSHSFIATELQSRIPHRLFERMSLRVQSYDRNAGHNGHYAKATISFLTMDMEDHGSDIEELPVWCSRDFIDENGNFNESIRK